MSRQEKYDTIMEALYKLDAVHSEMLNLACAGVLESKDFAQINSLYDQLNSMADECAPEYHMPTWEECVAIWEKTA